MPDLPGLLAATARTVGCTAVLALLGACGGGGGGASTPADTNLGNFQNVLFLRQNANGSSDLFRAPADGSAPPIAVTNHGSRTIDEILNPEALVAGRVVYKSRSSGVSSDENFFSVGTDAGSTPVQLTSFAPGSIPPDSYRLVGSTLIVRAFTGVLTTDLWAVPVDGTGPARNLTNLGIADSAAWDPDEVIGSRIFFRVQQVGSSSRRHYVFDTASNGSPVLIGPTNDQLFLLENTTNLELAPATEARYAASGNTLFLRGERNFGATFQLFAADVTTGALQHLSDSFALSTGSSHGVEKIYGGIPLADRFCYFVESHQNGNTNLFSASFGAATSDYAQATNFPAGSNNILEWKAFVASQPKLVIANETTVSGSNVATDLYVVDVAQRTRLRILDGSILGTTSTNSDIGKAVVLGDTVLFDRLRSVPALWSAKLDGSGPAGAEVLANVTDSKGIEGFVISSAGPGRTEMFGDDPSFDFTSLRVDTAFAYVTRYSASGSYSDLYLLSNPGSSIQALRLTAQNQYPDGPLFLHPRILSQRSDQIVYVRDLDFFSCPMTGTGFEARLTNRFAGVGTLAQDRIFYVADDRNLYSSPYTADVSAGQIRALTAYPLGAGASIGQIFPNGGRVVFEVQQGTLRKIFSSPASPSAPTLTDISQTSTTFDDALLLF